MALRLRRSSLLLQRLATRPLSTVASRQQQQQQQQSWWMPGAAAAVASGAAGLAVWDNHRRSKTTDCSGIAAVVGSGNYDARGYLLEGLTILKARGFDSAGLATVPPSGGNMFVTKFGTNENLSPEEVLVMLKQHSLANASGVTGMAHTRWATHGSRSDENAHPIVAGKVAVVHNGVLHNARSLRKQLSDKFGITFQTQTDTEVLAKLIDYYYNKLKLRADTQGTSGRHLLKTATERALSKCDGTWGLVVMSQDSPEELVVAANGSPLVIGMTSSGTEDPMTMMLHDNKTSTSQQATFVASEVDVFRKYTQTFVELNDGEVGVIQANGPILDTWSSLRVENLDASDDQTMDGDDDFMKAVPDPYPDWTLKEIYEQPEAIGRSLGFGGRLSDDQGKVFLGGLDAQKDRLKGVKHLIISGVSSSLHASKYGELLMKQISALSTVRALDAVDTNKSDFPLLDGDEKSDIACCIVSESGERKEALKVTDMAMRELRVPTLSVVNAIGSKLSRTTRLGVYCHAGRERAMVSTKSFASEVTTLGLLGLWFRELKEERDPSCKTRLAQGYVSSLKESLMRLPMAFGMALQTHEQCKEIAASLEFTDTCFVLGKGFAEPVAKQGAFKFQELASLHAEGLSASSLKHGSLTLIEPPVMYRQRLKTRMVKGRRKKTEKMKTNRKKNVAGTPVVLLLLDDQHRQSVRNAGMEVKARGGQVIVITDKPELAVGLDENPIVIPNNGPLTALGAVVPLQLLAYELAKVRGINPDSPRHLGPLDAEPEAPKQ